MRCLNRVAGEGWCGGVGVPAAPERFGCCGGGDSGGGGLGGGCSRGGGRGSGRGGGRCCRRYPVAEHAQHAAELGGVGAARCGRRGRKKPCGGGGGRRGEGGWGRAGQGGRRHPAAEHAQHAGAVTPAGLKCSERTLCCSCGASCPEKNPFFHACRSSVALPRGPQGIWGGRAQLSCSNVLLSCSLLIQTDFSSLTLIALPFKLPKTSREFLC